MGSFFLLVLLSALIAATGYALRRVAGMTRRFGRTPSLTLEVVERIAIAPKQGVAIVRVGERALLVSVGDGGVRSLMELTADECSKLAGGPAAETAIAPAAPLADVLRRGLMTAARRSAVIAGIGIVASLQAAPAAASAAGATIGESAAIVVDSLAEVIAAPVADADAAAAESAVSGVAVVQQAAAQAAAPAGAPRLSVQLGTGNDSGLRVSGAVGSVIMIGLLAMLPALLLLMTSFTRILIVLHFLRQALGTQTAPPAQLLTALALLLTGFVMAPTLQRVNTDALQPWMNGAIAEGEMLTQAVGPLRAFMLEQTPDRDLIRFVEMSDAPAPASAEEIPLPVLVTAFATSELRAAFQMGFAIFLPFIVIDLVVSAVLTSMGMFMLPPTMIALPCKLLLFVLADGWSLIVQSLVASFR